MRPPPGEAYRRQLVETIATVEGELAANPEGFRALYLADFLVELAGTEIPVPPALPGAAARLGRRREEMGESAFRRAAREEGMTALLWTLWQGFRSSRWLNGPRARALGERLAASLDCPLRLALLRKEEAPYADWLSRGLIDRAIEAAEPGFLGRMNDRKIDRAFVERAVPAGERSGCRASYYEDGHLREFARGRGGPCLRLDPVPGTGSFREEGRRGGSGYATSETYRDGAVRGQFFSPWHDGEEYTEPLEWVLWVAQCLGSVARSRPGRASA